MKLTVGEAAKLLAASDEVVYEWIENEALPAQRIRGQYRINRAELLEWATEHQIALAPSVFRRERGSPALADALRSGGVHDHIPGSDIREVFRLVVGLLPLEDQADREMLLQILLARPSHGVAPVGDGIAIPHVRMPIILASTNAVAALSFVTNPFDLDASDRKPVDTFILLICPTVHIHLTMVAKLAFALKNDAFRAALRRRAPAEEIVRIAASLEEGF